MNFDRPLKVMIHDAYGIFTLKRDGGGGDPEQGRNWALAKYIHAGRVMLAVESQPAPYSQILQFCYAPDYRDVEFNILKEALMQEFVARFGKEIKQSRVLHRARRLAEVALYDYKLSTQGQSITTEQVCEMAGIDHGNFYRSTRSWRKWYRFMCNKIHSWDIEARRSAQKVIDGYRESQAACK